MSVASGSSIYLCQELFQGHFAIFVSVVLFEYSFILVSRLSSYCVFQVFVELLLSDLAIFVLVQIFEELFGCLKWQWLATITGICGRWSSRCRLSILMSLKSQALPIPKQQTNCQQHDLHYVISKKDIQIFLNKTHLIILNPIILTKFPQIKNKFLHSPTHRQAPNALNLQNKCGYNIKIIKNKLQVQSVLFSQLMVKYEQTQYLWGSMSALYICVYMLSLWFTSQHQLIKRQIQYIYKHNTINKQNIKQNTAKSSTSQYNNIKYPEYSLQLYQHNHRPRHNIQCNTTCNIILYNTDTQNINIYSDNPMQLKTGNKSLHNNISRQNSNNSSSNNNSNNRDSMLRQQIDSISRNDNHVIGNSNNRGTVMPNNPITDNNIKKKPTKIQANAAVNNHVSMHTTPHNNNNNNYNQQNSMRKSSSVLKDNMQSNVRLVSDDLQAKPPSTVSVYNCNTSNNNKQSIGNLTQPKRTKDKRKTRQQQVDQHEKSTKTQYRCRICLQSQYYQTQIQGNAHDHHLNRIIRLPCKCKDQLGMIHQNCIKFWIKVWLQAKISAINHNTDPYHMHDNNTNANNINNQNANIPSNTHPSPSPSPDKQPRIIKPLNPRKLLQKTIYPFKCQICHSQLYFDLIYHRRVKSYIQISKRQLILFLLSLFFTVLMLGICINWIFQSGISLYLILFFVLGLLPITSITVTTFVWALTKKEFWVKQVYSLDEVRKLEYMLMNGDKNGRDKNFMGKQEERKTINKDKNHSNLKQIRNITRQKLQKLRTITQIFKSKNKNRNLQTNIGAGQDRNTNIITHNNLSVNPHPSNSTPLININPQHVQVQQPPLPQAQQLQIQLQQQQQQIEQVQSQPQIQIQISIQTQTQPENSYKAPKPNLDTHQHHHQQHPHH